ncbi:GNAT family N-acetyltransferase [Halobacillus shinanisalinarum]|uniref:GNAT family N-acetyltransferase n=1 Tax=Halobacillus shinanisalinarum TaxID=2932258 RepID=A0ABY4GVN7_9BACI|nr:GNAT family N-acetyltransferase [Halobacillus shinanisalinarum]UOQ92232.1 GNAT family N-acetyltransferase [Halobacillus shinanisalinarum]
MITELHTRDFYKCKSLLNEKGNLEVKAVIEGVNPGRIFVDNNDSPKTGLIWLGNNDGFFFIGNEENKVFNNDINDFIDKIIIPEAKKLQLNYFIAIGNHQRWNKTIEKVFKHRQLKMSNQKVYEMQKCNYKEKSTPAIEQEYKVLKINKVLFENNDNSLENIEFLRSKLLEFWSSPESFFNKGIGYCIAYNNKIISVCFSGFVAGNVHGLDIETIEAHQGNRLGQEIAHYVVKDCISDGMVPYWDCMETNKPSNVIAQRTGFTNVFNYVVYLFPF